MATVPGTSVGGEWDGVLVPSMTARIEVVVDWLSLGRTLEVSVVASLVSDASA